MPNLATCGSNWPTWLGVATFQVRPCGALRPVKRRPGPIRPSQVKPCHALPSQVKTPCGRSARAVPTAGEFGRSWSNVDQARRMLPEICQTGPQLANVGKFGAKLGRYLPDVVGDLCQNLAQVEPKVGQVWANFGRVGAKTGEVGTNLAKGSSKSCHAWSNLAQTRARSGWATPGQVRPSQATPIHTQSNQAKPGRISQVKPGQLRL